jgi:hypothetical protein
MDLIVINGYENSKGREHITLRGLNLHALYLIAFIALKYCFFSFTVKLGQANKVDIVLYFLVIQ